MEKCLYGLNFICAHHFPFICLLCSCVERFFFCPVSVVLREAFPGRQRVDFGCLLALCSYSPSGTVVAALFIFIFLPWVSSLISKNPLLFFVGFYYYLQIFKYVISASYFRYSRVKELFEQRQTKYFIKF